MPRTKRRRLRGREGEGKQKHCGTRRDDGGGATASKPESVCMWHMGAF